MPFRRSLAMAATFAVATYGLVLPTANAQTPQRPVAVVSIAPLDQLLQDTSYLLKVSNVPEVGGLVTIMANQYTQGLDRTRPIGVAITMQDQMPSALVFLPLSSREQFFGALAGLGIEPDDLGNGLFEIDANGQTLFAKDSQGWMFIAQTEDALGQLPADPAQLLGSLPKQYDIAVNLDVQALPPELKEMAIKQMRIGLERGMAEQRDMSAEDKARAKELSEANIQQLERMIQETEKAIVGLQIDSEQQNVSLDFAGQFISDSKLAKQVAALQDLTSGFTKLAFPNAAALFRVTSIIPEEDKAAQIMNLRNSILQLEQQIPEEDRAVAKDILQGLAKVIEQTIQEGTFDGAASVSLADDTFRALAGGLVADGRALEAELKKIAAAVKGEKDAPQFKFGYGTYQGMSLHSVQFPIKSNDPGIKKAFGDTLLVNIATADKSYLISVDPSGDAALKLGIDRLAASEATKVSPLDAFVEIGQVLQFAQALSPNPLVDNALKTIRQYAGKDKIRVAARLIERGGIYRLTVEEGVLRAGGAAAKSANNGGGGF